MTTARTAKEAFGCEIATLILDTSTVEAALKAAGIKVNDGAGSWSVTSSSWRNREGCEVFSPYLYGSEGLAEFNLALKTLEGAGATDCYISWGL